MDYSLGYFGDKRREEVGRQLFCSLLKHQCVSLRRLGQNRAGEVRFGRWVNNTHTTLSEIIGTITSHTKPFVANRRLLAIQDTTELNYQAHAGRVHGLGTVGNGTDLGFFLHPMLVVDACLLTCLGLAAITSWIRTQPAKDRKKTPIAQKESYRWIKTAIEAKKTLAAATGITIIADRESDIYEEWCTIPDAKTHLLTRACRDRCLAGSRMLYDTLSHVPACGEYMFNVQAGKRSAHRARMTVRYAPVAIERPIMLAKDYPARVDVWAIEVLESGETVVGKEAPVHWRLLTTRPITCVEEALQAVQDYGQRWHIEQVFRTLKRQGLDVESSQVESGVGLQKMAVIALGVAVQTMQLDRARKGADQQVEVVFDREKVKVLEKISKSLEGKTEKQKNPYMRGKLAWATWVIARLGGWKGYASERPPGPITLGRGLEAFEHMFAGYQLAKIAM